MIKLTYAEVFRIMIYLGRIMVCDDTDRREGITDKIIDILTNAPDA